MRSLGRILTLATTMLLATCHAAPDTTSPPNVVLVFCDDLGWGDLGCYGNPNLRTPNLDRLAAQGVRCTDFYCAQPVCSASRAAILTGCYPNRIGIHGALGPNAKVGLHADELTLAELCKSRGYATAIFGKWHLGHLPEFLPTEHGFDEFFGIPYSNDMHPLHPEAPKAYPPLPLFEGNRVVAQSPDQNRFTTDFTARAVAFTEKCAAAGRPFFLYLAQPMPHVPLHVSDAGRGKSRAGLYGDVIEELDRCVGQLLDALDRAGVAAQTLFVFTSDNGPWLSYGDHAGSTGGLREGKGTTFEGGVRVPFLARLPGRLPAGQVCRTPAMTIDLLPTIAGLIDAELPRHPIDGVDIWPWLRGEVRDRDPHEALFFYYHQGELEALRAGRYKLHLPHRFRTMAGREPGRGGRPGQYDYGARIELALYDLQVDPGETTDVAAQHGELVATLQAHADAMRSRLGDQLTKAVGSEVRAPGSR